VRGGVVAGVLFVLPGAITVLALSMIYVTYQQAVAVSSVFFGVKAAVLAVVAAAVWRLAQNILKQRLLITITCVAFIASFVFSVPFPLVIAGAALAGLFILGDDRHSEEDSGSHTQNERAVDRLAEHQQRPSRWRATRVILVCGTIWLLPVCLLYGWLGTGHIFVQQGLFFSQVAVVTFGGAYAVLSYMAQQTVGHYGWLSAGEMLAGLGMAETTPGPLIMVTQFVGFIGAYRSPGLLEPMIAGTLGALVTTWVTFAPCFLWIFLGAPYIEALRGNQKLARALTGITAAVVGVVLNLAIWFGLRVMFTDLVEVELPLGIITTQLHLPVLTSFDMAASAITLAAFGAIFILRTGMITVLATGATAGLVFGFLGLI